MELEHRMVLFHGHHVFEKPGRAVMAMFIRIAVCLINNLYMLTEM